MCELILLTSSEKNKITADERIAAMNDGNEMLIWWRINKPILQSFIQANPAHSHKKVAHLIKSNATNLQK